jgi:hypothetical protein
MLGNLGGFTMFELEFLVHQEQYKDRLRDIERQRLLRAFDQNTNAKVYRQVVGWLGARLVVWGLSLQQYVQDADKRCQESRVTLSMTPRV